METDLAAMLVLGIESGLLSHAQAVAVVDEELLKSATPDPWLTDASMSRTPDDFLRVTRPWVNGHPAIGELRARIDAADIALRLGHAPLGVGARLLGAQPWEEWPGDLLNLMWDLDEEVYCAHNNGGVPRPKAIAAVLRKIVDASERTPWRSRLGEVVERATTPPNKPHLGSSGHLTDRQTKP